MSTPKNEGSNKAHVHSANEPATPTTQGGPQPGDIESINEPPGSEVRPPDPAPKVGAEASRGDMPKDGDVSHETSDELPPVSELEHMTRAELDALAEERGVDTSGAHNKDEVIGLLRKDARKRK